MSCVGLRKAYGDRVAVAEVGFSIAAGETYGLLGPNGAGKTTTISMICGLLQADAGRTEVMGAEVTPAAAAARSAIGYVPQDLAIYPDLTAKENLAFFGRLQGLRRERLDARIDSVLEAIGLRERADDRAGEFSGGMKRRLNIGVGLLHEPPLLVLDEPTVGVDPQSRNAILDAVESLSADGTAVLYTTHYMEEAERLCDRVGIMDEGRVVAEGTRRDLVQLIGADDTIRLRGDRAAVAAARAITALDGVAWAKEVDGSVEVGVDDAGRRLVDVVQAAGGVGMHVSGVEVVEPNLEAVFLHLTGKQLRD